MKKMGKAKQEKAFSVASKSKKSTRGRGGKEVDKDFVNFCFGKLGLRSPVSCSFRGLLAFCYNQFRGVFTIDLRAVGFFRICFGLVLCAFFLIRLDEVSSLFTMNGVLPRNALLEGFGHYYRWSLFYISDTYTFAVFLFVIAFIFSVFFTIGFRTNLSGFVCWLMAYSASQRNPFVNNSGDIYILILLLMAMFLPLNSRFSVDNIFSKNKLRRKYVFSLASVTVMLQVGVVYLFASMHKTDAIWQKDFTALYYALSSKNLVYEYAKYMLEFPSFLKFLTFITIKLQFWGTILMFVPFFYKWLRLPAVLGFAGFHFGIIVLFDIGLFPYVCLTPLILLLPSFVWDKIFYLLKKIDQKIGNIIRLSGIGFKKFAKLLRGYNDLLYYGLVPLPKKLRLGVGVISNVFVVFLLLYVMLWNILSLDFKKNKNLVPYDIRWLGDVFSLNQTWNMFSPYPINYSFVFEIKGRLINGREVNIYYDGTEIVEELNYEQKYLGPSQRWKKFVCEVANKEALLLSYGRYITKKWNREHKLGETLDTFTIYSIVSSTPKPEDFYAGNKKVEPKVYLLWKHNCLDERRRADLRQKFAKNQNRL